MTRLTNNKNRWSHETDGETELVISDIPQVDKWVIKSSDKLMETRYVRPLQIENLDHLGLIAGVVDELGLVYLTNETLKTHKLQHISLEQVLKAIIFNGLGFVSAPLYLFSELFQGKPVEP